MKRLLSLVAFFATIQASAQQVNPVPDYVFRNQMSVGRGTVTDTAAYFSIGPRYGATKGFMPPIVGDTATFSSGKRNGLLIFSVQKNKFLYWDSVRVRWSDMAGSSGAYIVAGDTAAMLLPYLRKADTTAMLGNYVRHAGYGLTKSGQSFLVDTAAMATRARVQKAVDSLQANINAKGTGTVTSVATGYGLSGGTITTTGTLLVDTLNIATRAWRQKGLDSLSALEVSGSGTTNYVPKFTAASTIGNSQIFDNGTNVGLGTASPGAKFHLLSATGTAQTQGDYANNVAIMQGASRTGTTSVGGSYATTLSVQSNDDVITAGSGASIGFAAKWNTGLYSSAAQFGSIFGGKENSTDANLAGYLSFATRPAGGNPTERLRITSGGALYFKGASTTTDAQADIENDNTALYLFGSLSGSVNKEIRMYFNGTGSGERFRMFNNGRIYMGATPVDNGYQVDINGTLRSVNGANFATTSGNVGIGTASPAVKLDVTASGGDIAAFRRTDAGNALVQYTNANTTDDIIHRFRLNAGAGNFYDMRYYGTGGYFGLQYNGNNGLHLTTSSEVLINTTTDAGDYKLQVVGNARVGTGKLDIASNTTYGLGIARSGTSEVAGQIYNSSGILYTGVESSAGGAIFSGSSAYAAVIGSGANYPLQFATNNVTRATIDTDGDLGIATTTPTEKLDINGRARIRTIDSTSTAINLLYADVNGVIKKAPVGSSGVSGSGTTNYIPKFTGSTTLGNSVLYEASSELFINTTSDQGAYALQVNGSIYNTGQVTRGAFNLIGTGAQLSTDSTTNLSPVYLSGQSLTGSSAQALIYGNATWNTSGAPSLIDINLTNTASSSDANYIKISDGTNLFRVTKDAGIITAAPSGGTASKWKLGSVVGGSVTLNTGQYIEVEVAGATYRLAVVTLN